MIEPANNILAIILSILGVLSGGSGIFLAWRSRRSEDAATAFDQIHILLNEYQEEVARLKGEIGELRQRLDDQEKRAKARELELRHEIETYRQRLEEERRIFQGALREARAEAKRYKEQLNDVQRELAAVRAELENLRNTVNGNHPST